LKAQTTSFKKMHQMNLSPSFTHSCLKGTIYI
jgi:hypothetical protein